MRLGYYLLRADCMSGELATCWQQFSCGNLLQALAVLPASDSGGVWRAAYTGALLGAVSYATYELTNMATLSGWPVTLVVVDVLWGAFATGAAAALGYYTLRILGVVG